MLKKNFKIRVVLTFVTMLVMAMMLQSIVVMFLGVRAFIQEDVAWAVDALERETLASELTRQRGESNRFSCTYVELAGVAPADQLSCRFRDKVLALSRQASEQNKTVTGFAGSGWNTFLFGREVAIIAVPLVDKMGQVVGTIAAERSLLPIYARYKQDVTIVLSYLLVNALLFSSLSFFRILHLFFRPLDNLVQKAESYRPDVQTLFLTSDNESPFRKLSSRLSTLFDRIERDNLTLRQNLRELEAVNAELKERNELVARSEKLATAGRLSAGLAHEIGNPLAIIQGYIELLGRDDLTTGDKKQFSEKAQQELTRIQRLIRQLLDFSRPSHAQPEAVEVNALVTDVIGFVSMEKSLIKQAIMTSFQTDNDTIVVEKDALRQVLINCLFNALDATAALPDSEREIVVATSHEQNDQMEPLFLISIQDNGTGIAEEQLPYLFDPFFTTKDVGRGTGLGLFVCYTIMDKLAGSVTLRNRASAGVEVRLTLPLQSRRSLSSS